MNFRDRLYAEFEPFATLDQTGHLYIFCDIVGSMFQPVEDLSSDGPNGEPGYSLLLDITRIPAVYLPFLAQFVGVPLSAGMTDQQKHDAVQATAGFARGRPASIIAHAALHLIGEKTVILQERVPDRWTFTVITFDDQTPDPAQTLSDIMSQKPGGYLLNYEVLSGLDYEGILEGYATYADVLASFHTYDDLLHARPGMAGTIAIHTTATGLLSGVGAVHLAGTVAVHTTGAGALTSTTTAANLSGEADIVTSTSASAMATAWALAGETDTNTGATGSLIARAILAGESDSTTAINGDLDTTLLPSGKTVVITTVTGTLSGTIIPLSGGPAITTHASGALSGVIVPLAGGPAITTTASATIDNPKRLIELAFSGNLGDGTATSFTLDLGTVPVNQSLVILTSAKSLAGAPGFTISDSVGGIWATYKPSTSGTAWRGMIAHCKASPGGHVIVTVTTTTAPVSQGFGIWGGKVTQTLGNRDKNNFVDSSSPGTAANGPTMATMTNTNELIVEFLMVKGSNSITPKPSSPWSNFSGPQLEGRNEMPVTWQVLSTTAAPTAPNWTLDTSNSWTALGASFL